MTPDGWVRALSSLFFVPFLRFVFRSFFWAGEGGSLLLVVLFFYFALRTQNTPVFGFSKLPSLWSTGTFFVWGLL